MINHLRSGGQPGPYGRGTQPDAPPVTKITSWLVSFIDVLLLRADGQRSNWRLITSRWIWLVPSKIWVTLASRR